MANLKNVLRLIEKEKQAKTGNLDLWNQDLTELPNELLELENLHTLDLSSNQISDSSFFDTLEFSRFPPDFNPRQNTDIYFFERLKNLQVLNLSRNTFSNIYFLEKLRKLQNLKFSSNKISNIRPLKGLTNLQTLDLSSNQISDISFLENLTSLQNLDLRSNQISDISFLEKLTSLQNLDLSSNQISDISPLLPLIKMGKLKISLKNYGSQGKLNLFNNPITTPPIEIVNQGNQAIIDWFAANKKELKEIKIILIGEGKAGKTSLLRRLKEDKYKENEQQTDGINIESIEFGAQATFAEQTDLHELTGHFWDFGGQEIMNATHQFFLTKRSVYLLVVDARKDNAISEQISDWVKRIQSTGGNSSIIVVANKIDLNRGFGFVNQAQLQQEFPQIKAFVTVSCKENTNIDQIKNLLQEWIPQAELFHTEIDERWVNIKDQLQEETEEEHYLPETRFVEICQKHGLHDEEGQGHAIRFLHDLGLVMHFEGELSSAYYVLDPYWITYGVYQIVTSNFAAKEKGKVPFGKLNFIINQEAGKKDAYRPKKFRKIIYDRFQQQFLLDILCQFKLSFKLPHEKQFILPNLLDTNEPNGLKEFREVENRIEFVYRYDYLPQSVMPFIIVEKFNRIAQMWRTGCTLQHQECRGLISSYNHELTLTVIGKHKQKRDFMSVLRFGIDNINRQLSLTPKMLIPLPIPEILPKKMYANYQTLLKKEARGRKYHELYEPIEKDFLISELLEGITNFSKEDKLRGKLIDIEGKLNTIEKGIQTTKGLVKKTIEEPVSLQYPNVFTLEPKRELVNEQSHFHSVYYLQFYCGHFGHEHPVGERYEIKINKTWVNKALPILNKAKENSKILAPLFMPIAFLCLGVEAFSSDRFTVKAVQDYTNKFEVLEESTQLRAYKVTTADERVMEKVKLLLEKEDANRNWRNFLQLKTTKDGNYVWVCREHAGEYE